MSIVVAPGDAIIYAGMTSFFVCAAIGVPEPNITWWMDDSQVIPDDRINITTVAKNTDSFIRVISILQICDADYVQDSGDYRCIAEVPRLIDTAEFIIFVQAQSPLIEYVSPNQTVTEGTEVTLECVVSGAPLPIISWTSNDVEVEGIVNTTVMGGNRVSSVIELGPVTTSANYTCMAVNELGEYTAVVSITVTRTYNIML